MLYLTLTPTEKHVWAFIIAIGIIIVLALIHEVSAFVKDGEKEE